MCVEKNWPLENLWDTKTDELTMMMTRGVDGVVQQQNRVTRGRKRSVLINQYRCVCLSYRLMDEINSPTVFGSVYSEGGWWDVLCITSSALGSSSVELSIM